LDEILHNLELTTIIHGTFDQRDEIEKLASSHSLIFNFASSMDPSVTEAILRGVRTRKSQTGTTSVVYHLSGAGNFVDNSESGDYVPTEHRFNDANPDDVRTITAANLPNGPCDELLFAGAERGDAKVYFVCPGGTYGHSEHHIGKSIGSASAFAPGRWVDFMTQNIESIGFGVYVGSGTSVFGVVHVDDIVSLMLLVYQKILDTADSYEPEDVYRYWYNGIHREEPSKKVAAALAKLQARRGKIASSTIRSVAYKDAGFTARYIAGNMLIECNNSKSLGWTPLGPDLYTTLEQLE
jgi:nucleoside-diphosphate-sugar epimerase